MAQRPFAHIPLTPLLNRVRSGVFGTEEWPDLNDEFLVFRKVPEEFARAIAEHLCTIEHPADVPRLRTIAVTVSELRLDRGRARLKLADACLHLVELLPEHDGWNACAAMYLMTAARLTGPLILDELVRIGNKASALDRRALVLRALYSQVRLAFQDGVGLSETNTTSIERWITEALHVSKSKSELVVTGALTLVFLRPQTFPSWWRSLDSSVRDALLPVVWQELDEILRAPPNFPSHPAQRLEAERTLDILSKSLTPS